MSKSNAQYGTVSRDSIHRSISETGFTSLMKKESGAVIPSRARNLILHAAPENRADSSVRQRTSDFGLTSSCLFHQTVKKYWGGKEPPHRAESGLADLGNHL